MSYKDRGLEALEGEECGCKKELMFEHSNSVEQSRKSHDPCCRHLPQASLSGCPNLSTN